MKRFWKVSKKVVVWVIAAAVALGMGYYAGRISSEGTEVVNPFRKAGFDLRLPGETEKMVVTVDEVEAKILEIGELTSCEGRYTVTKGENFTRYMLDDIPVPGTTNHVEFTCSGIVKAGYDMEDVVPKVDTNSRTIYISLPEIQINSNQILWDDMECNERNNILNPIDWNQYQSLLTEIKAEGLKEAENSGFYVAVEENAKNLITNFLGCFSGYQVVFM